MRIDLLKPVEAMQPSMNIFYLHNNAQICAMYHCDKHVCKMIIESAQMLSTAHRLIDGDKYADSHNLYAKTHYNHPSAIWVRKSHKNYKWLYKLLSSLTDEYTVRYDKHHKTSQLLDALSKAPDNIVNAKFTEPPQCMPDEYKNKNTITAYRNFYIGEKARFAKWKCTEIPDWFLPEED